MKNLYKVDLKFDENVSRYTARFYDEAGYAITFVIPDSNIYREENVLHIDSSAEELLALNFIYAARDAAIKKAAEERPQVEEKGPG